MSKTALMWLTALVIVTAPTMAHAQAAVVRDLLSVERDLNSMCRGWSGDEKHTDQVCAVRDKMNKALNKMGYCYGKHGQIGADMEWHKCTRNSLR